MRLLENNITSVFLVHHSYHPTQRLDLGAFGRVKRIFRHKVEYKIGIEGLDDAVADDLDEKISRERP